LFLTIQEAIQQGSQLLTNEAISAPRLNAEVLLCHALNCDRPYLYAHSSDKLTELNWIHYGRYLNERLKGKPTQYITHRQEFFGRDFYVNEAVLIPRPETEHLVEAGLDYIRNQNVRRILDLGTGSGAIAISLALESNRLVLASDISQDALEVANRNRKRHDASVRFCAMDLLESVTPRSLDLLISNPPYVPGADQANMQSEVRDWEPHVALFAGDSGLEIYCKLINQASRAIKPGGRLLMELGYQSLTPVREMLAGQWCEIAVISDLAGWPRVLGATLAEV
jgi:release factor glutamine methyltransferase